ncbi:VIT1/CCC1 transporter family protein [Streptomyces marispadix]|uniref:SpdB2 protein n=1 Tax=Streptomyces marispadix TaxID=2922868 RepID=A0ABS9T0H1_9ACTN|nr:VIT1/CCC1 transporter family protein [Streptomyces marispadix]MCH6162026.1 hypothetical protein [Streptomyces marispadix]
MSVTELAPANETYAEGFARASQIEAETESQQIQNENERERNRLQREREAAKFEREQRRELKKEREEDRQAEEKRREEAKAKAKAEKSAQEWKRAAKTIAVLCVIVSLPLQIMAFWDPHAWFLVAAPFVLEGVAWALLKGAEAAIDDGRPSWHYRLGALLQALIAAGINYAHGSEVYGVATGVGGALCSLIGPMIWDLHENGRIAKRDGKPTLAERRRQRREDRAEKKRVKKVNAARAERDSEVWERALDLAAALGEMVPSEKTYRRAWVEIHGTPELGSTADRIAHTRLQKRAVRAAYNGPLKDLAEGEEAQVDSQTPPGEEDPSQGPSEGSSQSAKKRGKKGGKDGRKRNGGTPPKRRAGTVEYSQIARSEMSHRARTKEPVS